MGRRWFLRALIWSSIMLGAPALKAKVAGQGGQKSLVTIEKYRP